MLLQRFDAIIRRLQIEVDPLRFCKLHQQGAVRLIGTAGVTQQHHEPLLGLNKLRMAQLALALEAIEALTQRDNQRRERLGQYRATFDFHQIVAVATAETDPGAATVLVKFDGQTTDPAIGTIFTGQYRLQRRRLDVAQPLEQADQSCRLGGLLIGNRHVLGTATAALAIVAAVGGDTVGCRGHHLLQGGVTILLFLFGDACLDGLAGQSPFDEDRLALMATDTDAVVIEGVYRKFNALELGGLLLGLEKLGHKTWCL